MTPSIEFYLVRIPEILTKLLLPILLLFATVSTSCNRASALTGETKEFLLEEGIAHFAFEYPAELEDVSAIIEFDSTQIALSTLESVYNRRVMYVNVVPKSVLGITTPTDELEDTVATLRELFPDFQVSSTRTVIIAGSSALEYSFHYTQTSDITPALTSPIAIVKTGLIWISGSLFWELSFVSPRQYEGRTNADLAHVRDTFRILD